MRSSAPDPPRIDDAVRLRQWALHAFSSEPIAKPPECSVATWKLFLQTERCGLPLRSRLKGLDHWEALQPEAQRVLDAVATREMQEVLNARAVLGEIARLARGLSLEVAVLKGGVAAVSESTAVALWDVDVLLRPRDAETFAAALDSGGYTNLGGGSEKHLGQRFAPETLPIEVHTTLDTCDQCWADTVWERAIPLEGLPPLRRLAPRDHLWHLLTHVVVQHPHRAGAIRDLLLIVDAQGRCSEEHLKDLETVIAARREARFLRGVLGLAQQLHSMKAPEDTFQDTAVTAYFLHLQRSRMPAWKILRSDIGSSVFVMQRGPAAYLRWSRELIWRKTADRSKSPAIAWIEARAPRGGRVARVLSRMIRIAAAAPPAAVLAAVATRMARRAGHGSVYDRTESSN